MLGSAQLLEVADIRRVAGATAAGTTTLTNTVDMKGFDAIAYIVVVSGIVNGAQPVLTMQDGAASNGSDAATMTDANGSNIATAAVTLGASPTTGLIIGDVVRPEKRYVTGSLARATQNIAVDAVIAVLYRARAELPPTPATAYLASLNKLAAS
jgi:hypothetical protein